MRICVTGLQGQVVSALVEAGAEQGVEIIRLGRPDVDLATPQSIGLHLERIRPDAVISAAAYTAVDLAETDADLAMAVNGVAPGILAAEAARLGVPILHLSTDFVFDGARPTPYVETCPTGPLSVYGASKLAGEIAVAAANPRHVILRTSWVYSHIGKNFVLTMLRLAANNPVVRVVSDQLGCPTYAPDIAQALISIARQTIAAPAGDKRFGTFHMAGGGDTSWAGLASAVFSMSAQTGGPSARVVPIATADYPTPARRPANSRLDCTKLSDIYTLALPHWTDALGRCLARVARDRA